MKTSPAISVVPANEASWDDLEAVFGTGGQPAKCQCQRFKTRATDWDNAWAPVPAEKRAKRLREQTRCGHPEAQTTSGLVAYLDGEPVGWCVVEPRTAYVRLHNKPLVWAGRAEDKADDGVWAVTCFITRAGFRHRGVSHALARAAPEFARVRGAQPQAGRDEARLLAPVGNHRCLRSFS